MVSWLSVLHTALGHPCCSFQGSAPLQQPPAGCPSCPLAGHTQSLGGTVPLPVHARLQPPVLGGAWRNPRLGQGQRLSLPAQVHPRWHRQIPGDPRSPQGCDPNSQASCCLPARVSLSPHHGFIIITVAKGDQLHPYNRPLHKTNRPGNWDRPVKYFIVCMEEFVPQLTAVPALHPRSPSVISPHHPHLQPGSSLRMSMVPPHLLSPASQSLTWFQQHKAPRSILKNPFPFSRAPWHSSALIPGDLTPSAVSRVGRLDPALGQGRGQGGPLSVLCHLLHLQLKARGAESPPDTVMANSSALQKILPSTLTDSPCLSGKLGWHIWSDPEPHFRGYLVRFEPLLCLAGTWPVSFLEQGAGAGWMTLGTAITKQSSHCHLPSSCCVKTAREKLPLIAPPTLDLPGEISTNATPVAPREQTLNDLEGG